MTEDNTGLVVGAALALFAIFGLLQKTETVNKLLPRAKTKPRTGPIITAQQPIITAPLPTGLDALYQKYGRIHGMDWTLIKAIAQVESNENPQAINPGDPSYGLMQVLCVASNRGAQCSNRLPAIPGWENASQQRLLDDVEFNVYVGSSILNWNLNNFGFPKGIAVYNNWSARNDPRNGPFRNQSYVDRVLQKHATLQIGRV